MSAVVPSVSFLICSTPRSGSTLLCEALRNTGLAGKPEEYFQELADTGRPRSPQDYFAEATDPSLRELVSECAAPVEIDPLVDASRFRAWPDYFEWVLARGTTPNGAFGAKVMWPYLRAFTGHLAAEVRGCARARDDAEVLGRVLPHLRYVFVTREDRAGQAVSLWRALQTWRWRRDPEMGGMGESLRLRYSFEAIDHLVQLLSDEEAAWLDWFEQHGIEPLTLVYEEFATAYEATALAVLRHVGVRLPADLRFGRRRMRRQADELSREWVDRYTADLGAHVRL
jgi:trehalose 2-sulfotransferase